MAVKQTTLSSVSLIVLGDDLEPGEITRALGMFPDQDWRKGDVPQIQTPDGRWIPGPAIAEWGGWKKFIPPVLVDDCLEVQLDHWANVLASKAHAIRAFRARGWSSTLDCFFTASEPEVAELKADLLAKLAAIGIDIDINFYPHNDADDL
ncbi:MAG TPA: DUF4279 domain-containing protein [Thermoanaerobaculia bacterium]|jgi:hypothetical protein|nr:DUF4279 domain-containing protein [Thermoanaerobaculia bacterium]